MKAARFKKTNSEVFSLDYGAERQTQHRKHLHKPEAPAPDLAAVKSYKINCFRRKKIRKPCLIRLQVANRIGSTSNNFTHTRYTPKRPAPYLARLQTHFLLRVRVSHPKKT